MSLSLEKCSQPVIPVLGFLSHRLTKKLGIALIFDECFLQEALEKILPIDLNHPHNIYLIFL